MKSTLRVLLLTLLALVLLLPAASARAEDDAAKECTYKTYAWNTQTRKSGDRKKVKKTYADLTDEERDEGDPRCSVCSEDQVTIDPAKLGWPDLEPFKICHVYADQVKGALKAIADSGEFEITEISAYRVGRTRGKIDEDGWRTQFSNHSYGAAIDINADRNGLYGNCKIDEVSLDALKRCKLRVGGEWNPKRHPKHTVVKDGVVYKAFTKFWKWGGEIEGGTRDMMHFSISGY